ncbi:MAG: cytochrome c oxidase assembly protein [Actinobacteria bacterium]|nr:cytochrome c oxidase assembly protein [Actinomycetota bacterium]
MGVDPWRFQAHIEVWLLIIAIIASYTYAIRVIGPRVVPFGAVVTRRQLRRFTAGVLLMWIASDWPIHDISEEYLYSMHMSQHLMISYFVPPLLLLATPKWLFDAIFGTGRGFRVIKFLSRAPVAGLLFNVMVMVAHIPDVVNRSVSNGPLHYSLHIFLVLTAMLMWMPVCGPERSFRLQYGGMMIYLFLMSVVPTVPAAWLTFAEGSVYKHYDIPVRVWGLSVTTDQQLAGAVMKSAGSMFLWTIIVVIFFRRFIGRFFAEASYSKKVN